MYCLNSMGDLILKGSCRRNESAGWRRSIGPYQFGWSGCGLENEEVEW